MWRIGLEMFWETKNKKRLRPEILLRSFKVSLKYFSIKSVAKVKNMWYVHSGCPIYLLSQYTVSNVINTYLQFDHIKAPHSML